VWDSALAGDDPRPIRDRDEVHEMIAAADAPAMIAAYAALARRIAERTAPLLTALLASSDEDVRSVVRQCGWSPDGYEHWLSTTLLATLMPRVDTSRSSRSRAARGR
jgi:hypothetical protein